MTLKGHKMKIIQLLNFKSVRFMNLFCWFTGVFCASQLSPLYLEI